MVATIECMLFSLDVCVLMNIGHCGIFNNADARHFGSWDKIIKIIQNLIVLKPTSLIPIAKTLRSLTLTASYFDVIALWVNKSWIENKIQRQKIHWLDQSPHYITALAVLSGGCRMWILHDLMSNGTFAYQRYVDRPIYWVPLFGHKIIPKSKPKSDWPLICSPVRRVCQMAKNKWYSSFLVLFSSRRRNSKCKASPAP